MKVENGWRVENVEMVEFLNLLNSEALNLLNFKLVKPVKL